MLMLVGEWTSLCQGRLVRGPEDLGEELASLIGNLPQEVLLVLSLGPDRRVLECNLSAIGSMNVASAAPRDVFRRALELGAGSLVVAHNHPSGSSRPTNPDLSFTTKMIQAGNLLGIEVLDHLMVAGNSWRSLRESTELWDDAQGSTTTSAWQSNPSQPSPNT